MNEEQGSSQERRLVLMRGLPWCGKSYRAKELAGETGKIFSTDEYWYKVNFPDKPDEYSFNRNLLYKAHKWNHLRSCEAMYIGEPLIVIDNTNTIPSEMKPYVEIALGQGYEISIEEPTSDRWKEIRQLLLSKKQNSKLLKDWALKLEEGSKETHSVPVWAIEKMMWRWENNVTVDQIMGSKPPI